MRHTKPNAKVAVDLPTETHFGAYRTEALHAFQLGDGLYEILNVPLLAGGVHLHDVVRCEAETGALPKVIAVVTPSGYGTVHFIPHEGMAASALATLIARIRELGCLVERGFGIIGVAIPPETDCEAVLELLNGPSNRGELSYEAEL